MYKPVLLPFGKTIFQTKTGHSISSDTEFLVNKILSQHQSKNLKVLELGSGNGIISIMLSHYQPNWECTGIEIQAQLVKLSQHNCKSAGVGATFIESDLRENRFPPGSFDLVVSNPPYFPLNSSKISPDKERTISRHEILCTMANIFRAVKYNLKCNGYGYIMYPHKRIGDIEKNTKKVDLKINKKFILNSLKREIIIVKLVHK